MILDDFDPDSFLRHHWQTSPRLIRSPWHRWTNPLHPDELAGLACEEGVEARLITQARGTTKVEHGPFSEARLRRLGRAAWTLLVQAVDHRVPDVAALIEPFRIVPDWRIDDVMVSLAVDGGGVGPHVDQYDVFLIQGLGRRRWRIGAPVDNATRYRDHDELRLLDGFEATGEWVLEPGDMLYLPPGVPHDGVAVGDDCMTYSVGFRAPSTAELVAGWCDRVLDGLDEDDRYGDPDLVVQANPGEITAAALDRLHAVVLNALGDRAAFARWFAGHSTEPKTPEVDWSPEEPMTEEAVRAAMAGGVPLLRNPAVRFAFVREGETVVLFVDGEGFECMGEVAGVAERLCAGSRMEGVYWTVSDDAVGLLKTLLDRGWVGFEDPD